ncbi:MAG: hypothetical protein Q4E37_01910 [Tissierellia bacterium]|nr:hypothetical protein [Tissierellia bacterium]
MRKDIEGFLYYKEGKELIAANLSQLIHDDINRFELIMYLEGYRRGMSACKEVNELEILALKYFTVPELYNRKSLFHYDRNLEEIGRFRRWVTCNIHNDVSFTKNYVDQVSWYNRRVLKKKIKHLNTHLDRQIMINYDSKEDHYRESDSHLSTKELYGLSKKLYRFLHRDALKIYHRAYWNGLNDQVLKRYR